MTPCILSCRHSGSIGTIGSAWNFPWKNPPLSAELRRVKSEPVLNQTKQMSKMSRDSKSVKAKREGDVAFHFKLPKEGLALSRILMLAGCIKLVFRSACKVPTLTEQLVAAVMRLVYVDKKRPEFYYIPIPPGHPYHGRQYMQYEPQWLRGTPLGDILAEADWKMKCLHVGVRSDDLKQKFEAWSNKSELTGLATWMDFPPDECPTGRSIIMSCESARVHETETELLFVDDPKMKIVDQSNKLYSEYITHYFDSVAYHDEPLFLRMKEIIKLIVAVEWMKKRGVKVNKSWIWDCTKSQRPSASIPVTIKPTSDQLKKMLASMKEEHAKALQSHDAGTLSHGNSLMSYPANTTMEVTETSAIATVKRSIKDITETWTLQILDDHDLVFQHLNPQMPLGISSLSPMGLLIPDVTSWKELFAETVPWPHVWQGMGAVHTFTGGVTTRDIPVHHAPSSATPSHSREEVQISSSASRRAPPQKVSSKDIPRPPVVMTPPSDVTVRTNERALNERMAPGRRVGYQDGSGASCQYTPSGSLVQQTASVPASVTRTVECKGRVVSQETMYGAMRAPSPTSSTTSVNK